MIESKDVEKCSTANVWDYPQREQDEGLLGPPESFHIFGFFRTFRSSFGLREWEETLKGINPHLSTSWSLISQDRSVLAHPKVCILLCAGYQKRLCLSNCQSGSTSLSHCHASFFRGRNISGPWTSSPAYSGPVTCMTENRISLPSTQIHCQSA